MLNAIDDYEVIGVKTTLDFGWFAINHEAFRSGVFDTGFVQEHFSPEKLIRELPVNDSVFAGLVAGLRKRIDTDSNSAVAVLTEQRSAWRNRKMLRG
jgi:propionyl-CoA carboxylase alpha chain